MAGIKAATAAIISRKHTVCLFRKLALKWGFHEEHFNVIMSSFFFPWEVERTLFYIFQNLKQRCQGSQEAFSPAGTRPSNCGPGGLNTPQASIFTLTGLSHQLSQVFWKDQGLSDPSPAPQSRFVALPQRHLPSAFLWRGGTLFTYQVQQTLHEPSQDPTKLLGKLSTLIYTSSVFFSTWEGLWTFLLYRREFRTQ